MARSNHGLCGVIMDKTYQPQAIEQRWYQFWEQNGYSNSAHPWRNDRYNRKRWF